MTVTIELPPSLETLALPKALDTRLQSLLSKQDEGVALTNDEREEAEGLVELSEVLSLLKLQSSIPE